jgi:hypothetical protein
MFTRKLVIDRSIWRCGRESQFKHGNRPTALLDDSGMMCCLGQACRQMGYKDWQLLNKPCPQDVIKEPTYLTRESDYYPNNFIDTKFGDEAMGINDSEILSRTGRELSLYLLGKRHGILVQFIGEYTNHENSVKV